MNLIQRDDHIFEILHPLVMVNHMIEDKYLDEQMFSRIEAHRLSILRNCIRYYEHIKMRVNYQRGLQSF